MKLIIEDDEGHKTTVPFVREEITVGRQDGNTIKLTERNVSRKHARFYRQTSGVFVEDLQSYNGIRVNGDKIDGPVLLKEGDLVQIGDYDLAVQEEAANGAAANGRPTVKVDAVPGADATSRDVAAEANGAAPRAAARPAMATALIKSIDAAPRSPAPPAPEAHEIAPGEAPHLVVVSSELAGREFACIRSVITIGRGEECDVHIDHRSLSREHARLQREDDGVWKVVDLGASNPLQINGEEYAESALKGGDVISLGHIKLRFVAPGEDYTYAPEGAGKRSPVPLIVGGVVVASLAAAGLYFGVIRKPAQPAVPENPKEAVAPKGDLLPKEEPKKPEGTTAAEAKPEEKPAVAVKATKPEEKAPEIKPDLKAAPDEVAIETPHEAAKPEPEVKVPDKAHPAPKPDPKAHPGKPDKKGGKEPVVASAQPQVDEGADPKKKALELRTDAEKLIQAGNYEVAMTKLRQALALNPEDAIAHKYLGGCLINTGNSDEATVEYHKFINLAPNHPEAARVRQMLQAYEKARENNGSH